MTLVFLCACSQNQTEGNGEQDPADDTEDRSEMTGYITDKDDDNRILVTEAEGGEENYSAVWFSTDEKDVEIGDKVVVGHDRMDDSYPGQSYAVHLEVIEPEHPEEAELNNAEALHSILPADDIDVPVVTTIDYDNNADTWFIELMDGRQLLNDNVDAEVFEFEVEDE